MQQIVWGSPWAHTRPWLARLVKLPSIVSMPMLRKSGRWDILVIINCVFTCCPWYSATSYLRPLDPNILTLIHTCSEQIETMLPCPLFQSKMMMAIVKTAWMNVLRNNHRQVFSPIRSLMRSINAPKRKAVRKMRACLSAMWKEVLQCSKKPWKRWASTRAS